MVRPLALASLLAAFAPACATDSAGDDLSVVAAPGDNGKFDAASGKNLRFHDVQQLEPLYQNGQFGSLWMEDETGTVNVDTANEMVVSGTAWTFESPLSWPAHKILKLATRAVPDPAKTVAFIAFVPQGTSDAGPMVCGTANLFDSIAIDPDAREVSTNNHTYTFAECGIGAGDPAVMLFALPLSTTGSVQGPFKYRIDASAE
jgi:hypothetical protein